MTFTAGCVNWIMPSELFPPGVRSKAVSIAISTNWLTKVSFYECSSLYTVPEKISFGGKEKDENVPLVEERK